MVKYDGTVRNSLGDIVQFCYGEDGMDACFVEPQIFDTLQLSNEDFDNKYMIELPKESKDGIENIDDKPRKSFEQSVKDKILSEYNQLKEDRKMLQTFIFPNGD